MYVCICNKLNEKRIEAEHRNGAKSFEELMNKTGLGKTCGECKNWANDYFNQLQQRRQD